MVSKIDWAAEADTSWQRGGGASVAKPTVAALTFTKPADKTSPALWQRISTGTGFTSGSLKLTADPSAAPYASIALGRMFVRSVEPRTQDGKPVEDVSLAVDPLVGGVVTVPAPVLAAGPAPTLDDSIGTLTITGFTGSRPISFVKGGVQAASSFSAGGASVGKPFFAPFSLRKGVDGQSSVFRDLISQGRSMTDVTIDLPGSSAAPHVVYELEDVFVSEISLEGTGGSIEKVGLTPKVIRTLTTVGTGPTTTFCFDVPAGRVC